MSLNRVQGELIGDLGSDYVVAPTSRWKDTVLFEEAARHAFLAFRQSGSMSLDGFDDNDFIVQEYPRKRKLAFVFHRNIGGREHLYPYVFDLPDEMIADLRNVGRWGHLH